MGISSGKLSKSVENPVECRHPYHTHSVYRSVGGFGSGVCSVLWNTAFEGGEDGSSLLIVLLVEGVFRTVLVGG